MKLNIVNRLPKSANNACQLVFLFADGKLKGQVRKFDADNEGLVKRLYQSGDFSAKAGQSLMLHGLTGSVCDRVLLVGLGDRAKADLDVWLSACGSAAKAINITPSSTVISDCLVSIDIPSLSPDQMAEHLTRELVSSTYRFTLHSSATDKNETTLEQLTFSSERTMIDTVRHAAIHGAATANGMALARDLGNLAPNICTPAYLAEQAQSLASRFDNFTTDIVEEEAMQELGMGAFLSVSAGSEQPGKLIVMNFQGKKRAGSPVILVGKGVTFDTGGISMKGSEGMDEMKFDMCGAASVFGVMQALGELQPDLNVIGLIAAVENMPDGAASRPGDVVTSMSGKTIEILNTDAEGRLVLCDALTYSRRFKPSVVVDVATLTGAAVTALGHHMSAVFGNNAATVGALCEAGNVTGDRTWPMPMGIAYQAQLKSNFADLANIGGRAAGAITAACFLSNFAEDMNWAHLDIAGVAWDSGKNKGATGRPVPLLLKYLIQ
ncbi:MAG: leucyl aminopeptidase [Granulosicoccus sp.]